jgi:hypothetical protein
MSLVNADSDASLLGDADGSKPNVDINKRHCRWLNAKRWQQRCHGRFQPSMGVRWLRIILGSQQGSASPKAVCLHGQHVRNIRPRTHEAMVEIVFHVEDT